MALSSDPPLRPWTQAIEITWSRREDFEAGRSFRYRSRLTEECGRWWLDVFRLVPEDDCPQWVEGGWVDSLDLGLRRVRVLGYVG